MWVFSDRRSFGQLQSGLYIDAQIAHGAIDLCVTEENLNGAQITGRLVVGANNVIDRSTSAVWKRGARLIIRTHSQSSDTDDRNGAARCYVCVSVPIR